MHKSVRLLRVPRFLLFMLSQNLSTQSSALSTGGIVTPFTILQDEWVMLAPLGDHPHVLGIQRITPTAIANMASRFNGLLGKLGRLFGGAPTFEGHHDVEPEKYPNSKSYGWIMSLDARADGLWGRMTWTPEGREMLQNGAFKFVSPVFIGKPIGQQNGQTIFEPVAFKSLALTNEPNLPLPPLANSVTAQIPMALMLALDNTSFREANVKDGELNRGGLGKPQPNLPLPPLANTKDSMTTITQLLELPTEASADQILQAVTGLKGKIATLSNEATNLRQSASSVVDKTTALQAEVATLKNDLATHRSQFATERAARVELILANAIEKGLITLAQRADWQTKFEKDIANAETELANQAPALNTTSQTRDLGEQKQLLANEQTRRAELVAYLAEKQACGLSYDEAWDIAKKERAALFEQMIQNR